MWQKKHFGDKMLSMRCQPNQPHSGSRKNCTSSASGRFAKITASTTHVPEGKRTLEESFSKGSDKQSPARTRTNKFSINRRQMGSRSCLQCQLKKRKTHKARLTDMAPSSRRPTSPTIQNTNARAQKESLCGIATGPSTRTNQDTAQKCTIILNILEPVSSSKKSLARGETPD